jgi:hypothetical protein
MKKGKERRRRTRWQVAVLVRCSIPKFDDQLFEMEMWAKDVNEDGLKLEVARGLNIQRVALKENAELPEHPLRFEDIDFKKGTKIKIQDLFYDDEGSPFMNAQIQWAKKTPTGWALGVHLTDDKKKSKEMAGAFKDFLSIVKNPMDAIKKASRS